MVWNMYGMAWFSKIMPYMYLIQNCIKYLVTVSQKSKVDADLQV